MLCEALQRKAKHEVRLSNISDYSLHRMRMNDQRFLDFARNDRWLIKG